MCGQVHRLMEECRFRNVSPCALAPTWDDNEVLSTPDKVRFVLGFMNLKPGQSVLDLGTGTGVLLPYIAEKIGTAGHITAVDYSAGMLSRANVYNVTICV